MSIISVPPSAPAGAGILAQTLIPGATDVTSSGADSNYDDVTGGTVSFVVPPSGKVTVLLLADTVVSSGFTFFWALRKTSDSSLVAECVVQSAGSGTYPAAKSMTVSGLTAGSTLSWKWSQRTDGGGSITTRIVFGDAMIIVFAAP